MEIIPGHEDVVNFLCQFEEKLMKITVEMIKEKLLRDDFA